MPAPRVTLCVLTYGDHCDLLRRCMAPLAGLGGAARLRVWANTPGPETRRYLEGLAVTDLRAVISGRNVLKYPAMRHLFRGDGPLAELAGHRDPIDTEYTMWFDDDSWVTDPEPARWLQEALAVMDRTGCAMMGAVYDASLQGDPRRRLRPYSPGLEAWMRDHCSWYTGRPLPAHLSFVTGAWWTARTDFLHRYDWPHPALRHRGGDVLLGALCHQQELAIAAWSEGVAVNADASGNDGAAPRRGFDERPIGYAYGGALPEGPQ